MGCVNSKRLKKSVKRIKKEQGKEATIEDIRNVVRGA